MIVPINDDWRIQSDQTCWHLQERLVPGSDAKSQEPRWVSRKYLSSLPGAVREAWQMQLRCSEATTLNGAVNEIERINDEFRDLIKRFDIC